MHFASLFSFFFNDTATTEIYTLSLHDALPISLLQRSQMTPGSSNVAVLPSDSGSTCSRLRKAPSARRQNMHTSRRSEEHTSELQSRQYLVCRLLLEKKKKTIIVCFIV